MLQAAVFAVSLVLLCEITVIVSKPLPKSYQNVLLVRDDGTLAVQGLEIPPRIAIDLGKDSARLPVPLQKAVVIKSDAANVALSVLDPDTKKQYYLLKIKEYYDFLPLNRHEHDKDLRLEIVDKGDMGYIDKSEDEDGDDVLSKRLVKRNSDDFSSTSATTTQGLSAKENVNEELNSDLRPAVKREINDDTLKQNVDIFQTHYVGKRSINDPPVVKLYERRFVGDLGNFYLNSENSSGDPDDPDNNNFRYVAYVPFFRVRKYYIQRNRLDVGL